MKRNSTSVRSNILSTRDERKLFDLVSIRYRFQVSDHVSRIRRPAMKWPQAVDPLHDKKGGKSNNEQVLLTLSGLCLDAAELKDPFRCGRDLGL